MPLPKTGILCHNHRMHRRGWFIVAVLAVVGLALVVGAALRLRPAGVASLRGSPIPTVGDGRPGGPDFPQRTTGPWAATRTAAALPAAGLPTPGELPTAVLLPTADLLPRSTDATPQVFLATELAAELLTPSPTPDLLACLPPGAASDPGGVTDGDFGSEIVLVRWVIDGDSFAIDRLGATQTVRLLGVDGTSYARRVLAGMIEGQAVRLVREPGGPDADSVGRLLRYVLTLDGVFVNDALLRSGHVRLAHAEGFGGAAGAGATPIGGPPGSGPGEAPPTGETRGATPTGGARSAICAAQLAAAEAAARAAMVGLWSAQAMAPAATSTRIPTPTGPLTPVVLLLTPSATPILATLAPTTPTATATGPTATPGGPTLTPSPTLIPTPTSPFVAAGPTVTPPAAPTATTPPNLNFNEGPIAIINIFYLGTPPNEPNEYIEIRNTGVEPVTLTGWSFYSDETQAEVYFPSFILPAGQSCRVYTNQVHADSCAGISFGLTEEAWRNEGDCAGLYDVDAEGAESIVAEFCYGDYVP